VERARRGAGGTILELETERLHGHFIGDSGAYRPEAERKAMQDPIPAYRRRLLADDAASAAEITALEARVQLQVDEAMRFGRESAYPDAAEALQRVYAGEA
jgi:TPP-dependent pyruvate/acetoin dehydrogenase alpha subunit